MYEVLPERTPLDQITADRVVALVGHFTGRPPAKRTGTPMSVASVKTVLQIARAVLDQAEADLSWRAAPSWRRAFRVPWARLLTDQEARDQAFGADTFTDAELKHLYATANDRQRLFLLLGLNCGFTQADLAGLLLDDVDLKAGAITKLRGKTRAASPTVCSWKLWPRTKRLLAGHLAPRDPAKNPRGLALLSDQGRPLVDVASNTDGVGTSWDRLVAACERDEVPVRRLSYKYLRKTGSTFVLNHSDELLQQMYLGHRPTSVSRRHYTGRVSFDRLQRVLGAYHRHLTGAGVFKGG